MLNKIYCQTHIGMGIKLSLIYNVFKKGFLPVDLSTTLKRAAGQLDQKYLYTYYFEGIKTKENFLANMYFKIQHYNEYILFNANSPII